MKCLIVLPCYNEEENIRQVVRSIDTILGTQVPYRIIAVNDGCRDRTGEALKDLSPELPVGISHRLKNLGPRAALKTGLTAAAEDASSGLRKCLWCGSAEDFWLGLRYDRFYIQCKSCGTRFEKFELR